MIEVRMASVNPGRVEYSSGLFSFSRKSAGTRTMWRDNEKK